MTDETDREIASLDADGTYDSVKSDFPFDRVAMLLGIVQNISTVAPQMTSISGLAMTEIKEINDEARKIAIKRGEEEKRRQAEIAAKEQARINREAEEEAARVREIEERSGRDVLRQGRVIEQPTGQPRVLQADPNPPTTLRNPALALTPDEIRREQEAQRNDDRRQVDDNPHVERKV